jgi:(1->4)-alpha-D-glucan 1-alpha-D-glucosylmutase
MSGDALQRLCRLAGIAPGYVDVWGVTHAASEPTLLALLRAMGLLRNGSGAAAAAEDYDAQRWQHAAPPVAVFRDEQVPYRLELQFPAAGSDETYAWRLVMESGDSRHGEFRPSQLEQLEARAISGARFIRVAFDWREPLPQGYHRFTLQLPDGSAAATSLVVAPARCYLPPGLRDDGRTWGAAAQLYGVRSGRNWGIGDYTDVATLVEQWGRHGAGLVGVNPLHALYPHNPAHASPYGPSSRLFLNVLYLDVEAVQDFRECDEARDEVRSARFQERLRVVRATELVDYRAVASLKFPLLERLYAHFREHHLRTDTARAHAFREFQAAGGVALRQHALFEALQQSFHDADSNVHGFSVWPEAYRDPRSEEVARYAESHTERVEYYEYLQWQSDLQLANAAARAADLGMAVGLYADVAISIDSSGAEAWSHQDSYVLNATLGAPPDELNQRGQNWGLPPLHPERLRAAGYAPFIATLRANMRHAGAVRIDHVLGLARQFWIPRGAEATAGAYVQFPFEDLLGVLALESHRNRCMVIGEDLGTVPDEVRTGLAARGVLSYRLLYFERNGKGGYRAPAEYPVDALVAATTHDLPTLAGYWEGRDLQLRQSLDLYPSSAARDAQAAERAQDRAQLALALEREGLNAPGTSSASPQEFTSEAAQAVQLYLARSPARVLVVQIEDVLGVREQSNLPGTTEEHPNWKRKLPLGLERMPADPRFSALAEALTRVRPRTRATEKRRGPPAARIPRATYRLQLNRAFTFKDATALVPYLARLGVSHAYCSPYLRARPGSPHGYDIVDHNTLNPEIGTPGDFEAFVAALRAHGMGHVLDMVPNHVGVMGADSKWWLDVLENGPASAYAGYFDIEWRPPDTDLAGKVLVPVLGEQYGLTLARGELELKFDPGEGSFSVWYHDHRFPIDPRDYAQLIAQALDTCDRGAVPEPALAELTSVAAACRRLPGREETDSGRSVERRRGTVDCKQRLARLAADAAPIASALEVAARSYAGTAGREALHDLLERQAYRLAYWRASDEINYRRFFDINDLAALRMEDAAVFEATHRLALDLCAEGKLDGLRIDHPDGLYDPAGYFARLQQRYLQRCGFESEPPGQGRPALPLYVVVEKIAAAHEHVPESWAVHGTTGYRFAAVVNGLFVDGAARDELDRIYHGFAPEAVPFDRAAYDGRRIILRTALASALTMLSTELLRIARADRNTRDYTLNTLRQALFETIACFPVYRTYIAGGEATEQDRGYVDWAIARARGNSGAADFGIFDFVRRTVLGEAAPDAAADLVAQVRDFAMKFQQVTAPVTAKGVEDTACYRYNRLVSLNDVGFDPATFGFPVSAFHGASAERAAHWPHTLLATSTHDNKRAEDVRARINVISEFPAEWEALLRRWTRMNRSRKRVLDEEQAPAPNDEYLLYQTLVGTFRSADIAGKELTAYRARISDYMLKAVREAKLHSSWTAANEEYEAAITGFVEALLAEDDSNLFLADLRTEHERFAWFGALNSLSATLIKFASPGVPDIYQGTELPALSLVDPDNRRPVDYARRRQLLDEMTAIAASEAPGRAAQELPASINDGRARFWVIWRALQLRAEHPGLFRDGDYVALEAKGPRAPHVVAFARRHGNFALIAVAGRLWGSLGPVGALLPAAQAWGYTAVDLTPLGRLDEPVDTISRQPVKISGSALRLSEAFAHFPGALILCRLAPQRS